MKELFFISGAMIVYTYIGYFGVIYFLGKFFEKKVKIHSDFMPKVSMIIPVKNEALTLEEKLKNTLDIDYPKDKMEILVIDSSSDDDTANIVRSFSAQGVKLLSVPHNGKAFAMKYAIDQVASGDIIVSTDANAYFQKDALTNAMPYFSDMNVGGLTGSMMQIDQSGTPESVSGDMYWKMERFLRIYESKFHSCISLSGEMSCFRTDLLKNKEWYHKGHPDDFDITLFLISLGKRVLYIENAHVYEKAPDTQSDIEKQKLRIIVQTLSACRYYISHIFIGRYGIIFFSHKILALMSPFFLALLFVSNIFLLDLYGYIFFFGVQVFFYLLFFLGIRRGVFQIPYFVIFLNQLICKGYIAYFSGKDFTKWDKILSSRTNIKKY